MTDAPVAFTVSAHSDAEGASLRAGDDDLALETRWQPASASTHPGPAELLHRNLQKFGTVYNTVAAVCAVSGTVSVTPPTA